MTTTSAPASALAADARSVAVPPAPGHDVPTGRRWLPGLLALVVGLGVLARLHSFSALWLDEALTVNIASVPLPDLAQALRQDGAPPLYYLLLKAWMAVFGSSDTAVRALSTVWSLLALPLVFLAGRRLREATTGWCALVLLAVCPFAVAYASEARMYSMVMTLVLLGVLALTSALARPDIPRLLAVALLSGTLALTHYWSLFLLATVGVGLLVASLRGPRQPAARRCAVALAVGGLLFLPWLPSFLFQSAHTGTPWATPPSFGAVLETFFAWSGRAGPGLLLGLVLLALVVVALYGRPFRGADGRGGLLLGLPADRTAALLAAATFGTLALGIAVGLVSSSGYAPRYSSPALPGALLLAALGLRVLPHRGRLAVTALAAVTGLGMSLPFPFTARKTQAPVTAAAIAERLAPGDVVVYCPDQLGPAVSRLLPPGTAQVVYPSGGPADRIDWVDYARRNAAGDPERFAARLVATTPGAIWLVSMPGYRTFGHQCEELSDALTRGSGGSERVLRPRPSYGERQNLVRFTPRTGRLTTG